MIRILFAGDVVGKPGRNAVRRLVPELRKRLGADFVIANAENAAGGSGVTAETTAELLAAGVDVLTSGDHIWRNKGVFEVIGREERLIRPANYPPGTPGSGSVVVRLGGGARVGVVNLLGRVFMKPAECPFRAAARELEAMEGKADVIVVDMHAEATSEKIAMGRWLDGRVAAVIGTHTHVQTADETVLPRGTAYITEAGMTGPVDSVLGREVKPVVEHFLTQIPRRFDVAGGPVELHGVLVTADEKTGRATAIERVRERLVES